MVKKFNTCTWHGLFSSQTDFISTIAGFEGRKKLLLLAMTITEWPSDAPPANICWMLEAASAVLLVWLSREEVTDAWSKVGQH